jgi:hypothetical protein
MRYIRLCLWSGILLIASSSLNAQEACDRACLNTVLDQYLDAVVSNDSGEAPLAYAARQTVNAINVPVGAGVWQSVTALGDVQRRYFDPVSGQAAYYGSVEEGDQSALVTIRVKVENRSITEAEWYIARADDPGMRGVRQPGEPPANLLDIEYLKQNSPPDRVVPVSERVDRDALIRIGRSYFDALTSHDRTVAMAHPGCGRAENGSPAPGGLFFPPKGSNQLPSADDPDVNDCLDGLEGFDLQMVSAVRVPLADVEAQAVLTYGVFIRRPGSTTSRLALSEWFFVDQAKIRTVYTAMFYPPAELAVPNWPPYGGNWPLPAGIVPTP